MDDVRRHAAEQFFDVVVDDLVGNFLQLNVGKVLQDPLLRVAVEQDEYVRGDFFVQASEQLGKSVCVQFFEYFCQIFRSRRFEQGLQVVDAVFVEQLYYFLFHGNEPPYESIRKKYKFFSFFCQAYGSRVQAESLFFSCVHAAINLSLFADYDIIIFERTQKGRNFYESENVWSGQQEIGHPRNF